MSGGETERVSRRVTGAADRPLLWHPRDIQLENLVGSLSKRMQEAVEAVGDMSAEQQDLLALELMERLKLLTQSPTRLSREERAELEAALAAARRGEFANNAEVEAMYTRHGL